jgi:hypothetical protein
MSDNDQGTAPVGSGSGGGPPPLPQEDSCRWHWDGQQFNQLSTCAQGHCLRPPDPPGITAPFDTSTPCH